MILSDREPWAEKGACKGLGDLYFADHNETTEAKEAREAAARAVCAACPVLAPCREYARANQEHGFWGGENDEERRKAINNRRRGRRRSRMLG